MRVQLESEQHLAELRVQKAQAEVTLANETQKAELRPVLEASLAKDGALEEEEEEEEDEDEDDDEHESSHDQRLKQHYAFPNVGKITVADGAGAYQVLCGLDKGNFKVIDNPASSSQSTSPQREERTKSPANPVSPRQETTTEELGRRSSGVEQTPLDRTPEPSEIDPRRRDVRQVLKGPPEASRASEAEATGGACHPSAPGEQDNTGRVPQTSEPEAPGGAHAASPQAHGEGRYQETPLRAPSLEPPRRELDVASAAQSHEELLEPVRGRPGARRDHSTEAPGSEHMASTQGSEGGLV